MDPQQQPPVPVKKTLVIVNHFIVQTTRFLNHFSTLAEEKLQKVFHDINRIETTLVLLESRLHRLEGFDDLVETSVTTSALGAPSVAAAASDVSSLPPLPQLSSSGGAAAPPPPVAAETVAAPPPPPEVTFVMSKDDPALANFFRQHKFGASIHAIKLRMQNEGFDPAWLDFPEAPSPLQTRGGAVAAPVQAQPPPPAAAPAPAPAPLLAIMPPAPAPAPAAASAGGGSGVSLKDCPEYGPFLKKLQVGVPRPAVEAKMRASGLDPAMLDKDPSFPSPFSG
jgi:hypothetical protein